MMKVRKAGERGRSAFDWLDSRHSFSFADYHDPGHMGFGPLRVINDDRIAGGAGFPMHAHADMEILTYVLAGRLAHKDSLGNGSALGPGEIQRMSAGRGIRHSEFNASEHVPVHLLQIWLLPGKRGLDPSYEQKPIGDIARRLELIASRDGREQGVTIHQDVSVFAGRLAAGEHAEHRLAEGRLAWLQIATGSAEINAVRLDEGDAASCVGPETLHIRGCGPDAEFLLFDMAP